MNRRYRLGFVMEQTLGHVTHAQNMRPWVCADPELDPVWVPVPFAAHDIWQRTPFVRNNWTLRAGLRAGRMLARSDCAGMDGLFCHTQVTAVLLAGLMRRIPTVVSLDATPLNVDSLSAAYDHRPSRFGPLEALKSRLNRRAFHAARRLTTWCDWAKRSLVDDYGVPAAKVTVIPPGVDVNAWSGQRPAAGASSAVRLLFVGGDFRRKGGPALLSAFRRLPANCALDIVTRDTLEVMPESRVRVHARLSPDSPPLRRLFADADVFVLPTLGDCLPIAVIEAMAAGLPVVASSVGAIDEEVEEGVTGFLVPPGDERALADRISTLVADGSLRIAMGATARARAAERYDAGRNYRALIGLCKEAVDGTC